MKNLFSLFILIFAALELTAQTADTIKPLEKFVSIQYSRGPVFDHRKIGSLMNFGMPYGISLQYWMQTDGRKQWESQYGYPQLGFAAHYFNYDNKEILGQAFAGAAIVKFVLHQDRIFLFNIGIQAGISYNTKPFDKDNNIYNQLIGSHVNFFLQAGPEIELFRNKNVFLIGGFNFIHFSDGATKLPNLGINLMQWHVGASYRISPSTPHYTRSWIQDAKKWQGNTIISFGWREAGQPCGPTYFITTFNTGFYRTLTPKNKVGAGIDIMRDPSDKYYYVRNEKEYSNSDFTSLGLNLRYGLVIGKLTTIIQWGFYLKERENGDGTSYHRIGVNYQITRHILANLSLKTFYARAEYIEFGVGWQW